MVEKMQQRSLGWASARVRWAPVACLQQALATVPARQMHILLLHPGLSPNLPLAGLHLLSVFLPMPRLHSTTAADEGQPPLRIHPRLLLSIYHLQDIRLLVRDTRRRHHHSHRLLRVTARSLLHSVRHPLDTLLRVHRSVRHLRDVSLSSIHASDLSNRLVFRFTKQVPPKFSISDIANTFSSHPFLLQLVSSFPSCFHSSFLLTIII